MLANKKLTRAYLEVLQEGGIDATNASTGPKSQVDLLYLVATAFPKNAQVHRRALVGLVRGGSVKGKQQLDGGMKYLKGVGGEGVAAGALEEASGVGV